VLRKIGESQARALFVSGARFDTTRACAIGLVHQVVPFPQLDEAVQQTVQELLNGGPQALRACKKLALMVGRMDTSQARMETGELIARLRTSEEGQEGLRAFLEKRSPRWQQD
jgi:methylglutaconyl-CoA hydratase